MTKPVIDTKSSLQSSFGDRSTDADAQSSNPPRKRDTAAADGANRAEVKSLSSVRTNKKPPQKPEVAAQIGRQLRTMYNDVLAQPVPDRFLDLLTELDIKPEPAGKEKK